mmetsp:Transcript_14392/g.41216  ORF Transcript_14392/g.41216 Transcript_14392/m.41216 type:complete len:219 (+) Transcript_14392:287-943(+)
MKMMCVIQSWMPAGSSSSSSSSPLGAPLTYTASRTWSHQFAWPTLALSQFTASALISRSTRSFPACSDSMKTVRMSESAPPSVSASNLAPPVGAVRITRKFSERSYLPRALMFTWIFACVSLWSKVRTPSSSSKSWPAIALAFSVLYRQVTFPVQPFFLSTMRSTRLSSTLSGTLMWSCGNHMTPGRSSSMITIVARWFDPSSAQPMGSTTAGQKRSM